MCGVKEMGRVAIKRGVRDGEEGAYTSFTESTLPQSLRSLQKFALRLAFFQLGFTLFFYTQDEDIAFPPPLSLRRCAGAARSWV